MVLSDSERVRERMETEPDRYRLVRENACFRLALGSEPGTREEQQDRAAFSAGPADGFVCLCDGMGGHAGGRRAASLAAGLLLKAYLEAPPERGLPGLFLDTVDILDEAVCRLRDEACERLRAGTTLVTAAVRDGTCSYLSVGDSRLYLVRSGEIRQLTRDHNYRFLLERQLQAGEIGEEEYQAGLAMGGALVSYIGVGGIHSMDCPDAPLALLPGDRLLLATDGLYKLLSDSELLHILLRHEDPGEALDVLLYKAERTACGRDRDNTTAALLQIKPWEAEQ